MDDERQLVIMTSRKGDPTEPTISDVVLDDLHLVFVERPRTPLPADWIEGAPHPCIPRDAEGITYDVDWTENVHPKHPFCYEIMRVPGRTAILQHSADVMDQLEGCQAPGLSVYPWKKDGIRPGMPHRDMVGVVSSVPALNAFLDKLQRKNYRLKIMEA